MFEPLYALICNTLRTKPGVTFDGQMAPCEGVTYRVPFIAKIPAPGNVADIDLADVFIAFPEGFVIQRITDLTQTRIRVPVNEMGTTRDQYRGDFLMTVTKPCLDQSVDGIDGHRDDPGTPGTPGTAGEDDSLEDILQRYRKLPEAKQKIFIKFARTFLKGVAL